MKNILTEALVNSATNASFIFWLYKFCKVKDTTTNIQSCEQDMTLSKPGHREYQIW